MHSGFNGDQEKAEKPGDKASPRERSALISAPGA